MSNLTLRQKFAIACNVFIVIFTLVAWTMTVTGWGLQRSPDAVLMAQGFENLKYFTVLSNLFSGIASALYIIAVLRAAGNKTQVGHWISVLKLAATVSVALTFLVVVVLFTLIWRLRGMFWGANIWFHLTLPLAALFSTCVLETDLTLRARDTFLATLPMVLYGMYYYANILINGRGEAPHSNDWYGFASWGMEWAPVVFVIVFTVTLLVALLIYTANRLACRVSMKSQSR